MATSFPGSIQSFTQMLNILATDGTLIAQYQAARNAGNITLANQILAQIPSGNQKLLTADKVNDLNDTCVALEQYYLERYSPAYIVSATQPALQNAADFWFEVTTP